MVCTKLVRLADMTLWLLEAPSVGLS